MSAFFAQSCPTCGRQLRIKSDYAKHNVTCQHCSADFLARDPRGSCCGHQEDWRNSLMKRVDKVLAMAAGIA